MKLGVIERDEVAEDDEVDCWKSMRLMMLLEVDEVRG
jgi:hypothetical protein